jgi:UDP-glucose 4-epimerase
LVEMRVAITGAGGLLGGAVLRCLIESGHEVVALSGSLGATTGIEVVRWNAQQDWANTAEVLRQVEVLVHAGAHIPRDHNDPAEAKRCFEVNALGTLNLLRAGERAGVRRFIYVSGANVLSPRSGFVREDDPVGCEYSPYYLGSKVLGEIYVRAQIARGLDGLIVRPASIYGPGMRTGVIWNFAERIRSGAPIYLEDNGRFRADYVWRNDVAKLLSEAVVGNHRGELNLGSGQASSILDVAQLLVEIFTADLSLIQNGPIGSQVASRSFAPVDINRAREWFSFHPTSLRDGLIRWFVSGAY